MMTTAAACLAAAIYFEARSEPIDGQIAVAEVVVNRVESGRFPDSVCDVVTENRRPNELHLCQFSFYCDGKPEEITEPQAWATAEEIARGVLAGDLKLGIESTHYHSKAVDPFWNDVYKFHGTIGNHEFYLAVRQ